MANFIFPFLWLHCLNKAKGDFKWKCPVEFRDRESTQIVSGRSGFGELYRGDLKRGKKKATFPFFGNVAWQSVRSVCGLRLVPFSANHKKANHRKAISFFLNIFVLQFSRWLAEFLQRFTAVHFQWLYSVKFTLKFFFCFPFIRA